LLKYLPECKSGVDWKELCEKAYYYVKSKRRLITGNVTSADIGGRGACMKKQNKTKKKKKIKLYSLHLYKPINQIVGIPASVMISLSRCIFKAAA
jgi:acetamidase/formamidase